MRRALTLLAASVALATATRIAGWLARQLDAQPGAARNEADNEHSVADAEVVAVRAAREKYRRGRQGSAAAGARAADFVVAVVPGWHVDTSLLPQHAQIAHGGSVWLARGGAA